ncbi:hypothetical protein RhiirC2_871830, partial [Rhizophagus irregularis]
MDDISVKINEIEIDVDKIDVDKIDIDKTDVDKNEVDKIFTFDNINDEPHNGKPITMIEISPNENYLITYSKKDRSVAGWNVKDMDKVQLKFDQTVKIDKYEIESFYVSDDKKLAYVYRNRRYSVIDMNNKDKKIALDLDAEIAHYCTFNLKELLEYLKLFGFIPHKLKITNGNFVFGILNGHVWKSSKYSDELNKENSKIIECNDNDKINKETYEHSNINLYMDTVSTLFQEAITNDSNSKKELTESDENLIKWDVRVYKGKINLEVFNKYNTIKRIEIYYYPYK